MKIYRRPRTWIIIGILIFLILAVPIFEKVFLAEEENTAWKSELKAENLNLEEQINQEGIPQRAKEYMIQQKKMNDYALENDIAPGKRTAWTVTKGAAGFITLLTIFTVIIAADMVAGEFSWGTIKLLLIRPVNRSKILVSKFIATLLFAFGLLITLFTLSFLIGSILYGWGDIYQPYITMQADGTVTEGNVLVNALQIYGLSFIELMMLVTFGFMMSTIFRSNSLAIGLTLFLMFTGNIIVFTLSGYDWVKYVWFSNMYLSGYVEGQPLIEGMTLGFSLAMLAIYFVLFNLLTWVLFNKRDVAT